MQTQTAPKIATKHQSIRLFKNPVLEALTHVHPSMPFVIWIPTLFYLLYLSATQMSLNVLQIAAFVGFGLIFWTTTEYFMHRFAFHYPATSRFGKWIVFLFHGNHHDDPQDPTRLVMPPVVSISLGYLFYLGFKLILGAAFSLPFFIGFMSGYLVYDFIHFSVHHFKPRTVVGRTLKDNHMKHHFLAKKGKWGVSSPFWDHVFRTYKQE